MKKKLPQQHGMEELTRGGDRKTHKGGSETHKNATEGWDPDADMKKDTDARTLSAVMFLELRKIMYTHH